MRIAVLLLTLCAGPALAQDGTQGWSVVGGRTVGNQATVLEGGFGFPGLHVSLLRGVTPKLDIGARFAFDYGIEGLVNQVVPGIKFQGLLHLNLLEQNQVSLKLTFEPGPLFHFYGPGRTSFGPFIVVTDGYTMSGLALPLGLRLGIAASSALNVGISFELPMWIAFGNAGNTQATFQLPILMGAGVEYFVKSNLLVLFDIRMGPTLFTSSGTAQFTLVANVGVGYRF